MRQRLAHDVIEVRELRDLLVERRDLVLGERLEGRGGGDGEELGA